MHSIMREAKLNSELSLLDVPETHKWNYFGWTLIKREVKNVSQAR